MNCTEEIKSKLGLKTMTEVSDNTGQWSCFDDGSAELETLEFLYAFVRLIKPESVLETGTYKGLSSCYLGLALKENGKGVLDTIEIEQQHLATAKEKWQKLGISNYVVEHHQPSLEFEPKKQYDLFFLDSEPWLRFKELSRFYDNLKDGGFVFIHDMPRNLCQGNVNPDHPGFKHWPVGELSLMVGEWVKIGRLKPFYFKTPRGLWGGYKKHKEDYL